MKDILDCRIEAVLQDIELTRLCHLPEDEAVSVEEFVSVTERTCHEAAESLSKCVCLWNHGYIDELIDANSKFGLKFQI